jgi:tetratricopeptide (TPR) repeat protein
LSQLASVQKFDALLQQETTPSLEALKADSLGQKAEDEKGPIAALRVGRGTWAVPLPERALRPQSQRDFADAGPSRERTHHWGCGAGALPAHGKQTLLGGTISSLGSHYLISLNAVACSTGDTLAKEQGEADKEDVLKALSRASSSLRGKLGESLAAVQKFDVPVEATTSSLEALKNYSMSVAVMREKGDTPSIPFLRRAIELDPNFPMAYAALAVVYRNSQRTSLALEYATKAYQLRDRVSEREKLRITADYFLATGEVEREAQTYELWLANYPRDVVHVRGMSHGWRSR